VKELTARIEENININIEIEDFITFFKHRKEKTASSPSGHHMGHYKVMADFAKAGRSLMAETIINIINTAIITSRPLQRWKRSAQVMLEKGKGKFVENLRIIQLCEADLNFTLNILWGFRLLRHASKHQALCPSQYARPGITCQIAVWNKVLFCDLTRQTQTSGIMTDYDASAAFDRVLHTMSILTCRRLGMPSNACMFMYHLLQNMDFHLITGYGPSLQSFKNNEDPLQIGQGLLQGSSSAAPIYNFTTDMSLTTYNKIATGASFTHPSSGVQITDKATQYVDDKTETINTTGMVLADVTTANANRDHLLLPRTNLQPHHSFHPV
jgi:hypothetical protein